MDLGQDRLSGYPGWQRLSRENLDWPVTRRNGGSDHSKPNGIGQFDRFGPARASRSCGIIDYVTPTRKAPSNTPYFLTTGEFCQYARLSVSTVKRMCAKGELAHVVISERGDRRIPRRELDRLLGWAEANRVAPPGPLHADPSVSYPLVTIGMTSTAGDTTRASDLSRSRA